MKQKIFFNLTLVLIATACRAQEVKTNSPVEKTLYENNFEKAELDRVPSEFLVLDGGFAVKQDGTNKLFELPGAPLETFGVLFGPTVEANVEVSAKIRGTAKGRRFPTFAIGLNGVGGYKLQVSSAKKALELTKGDEVVATVPYEEKIGLWMTLQLRTRKIGESAWKIEGNVWLETSAKPKEPLITFVEKTKPVAG
ncbi:MAG: hypothetical protein ABI042_04060, partial [Verrucomicrobiota bacterium]